MTVSADTKLVAAGFSDSLVRLYHLALLGKQRGKLAERAEKRAAGVLPQAAGKRARVVSDCCRCIAVG
jgi:hypothetical protein